MMDSKELTNYLLKDVVKPGWTGLMSPKWLQDNGDDYDKAVSALKEGMEVSSFEWKNLINTELFDAGEEEDSDESTREKLKLVLEALLAARAHDNWSSDDILGSVRTKWGQQKTKNLSNLEKRDELIPTPRK